MRNAAFPQKNKVTLFVQNCVIIVIIKVLDSIFALNIQICNILGFVIAQRYASIPRPLNK